MQEQKFQAFSVLKQQTLYETDRLWRATIKNRNQFISSLAAIYSHIFIRFIQFASAFSGWGVRIDFRFQFLHGQN